MISAKFSYQDDLAIWRLFKAGDKEAFAYIYNKHVKLLFLYGRKILDDTDVIEDCIHETFVELWSNRIRLGDTDSIKRYLFKILRRKLIKVIGGNQRIQRIESSKDLNTLVENWSVEESMIRKEVDIQRFIIIKESFKLLTNRQREILYLRYFEGLDYEEISDVIDINLQSAKNIVYRALVKIREQLSKEKISRLFIFFSSLTTFF